MTGVPVRSRECSSTSCCRTGAPPAACSGPAFCPGCRDSLIRLAPPLCDRCGSPGAWPVKRCAECSGRRIAFASARAAIVYDAPARRFVQAWKEHGQRRLARDAAAIIAETLSRPAAPVLAFVPADGGAGAAPRPPAGRGARARARPRLGAAGRTARPTCALGRAPARTRAAGAATERSRRVRVGARVAGPRLPRRRRLHERRHRRRGGIRAQAGRRAQSGGGDARAVAERVVA